MHGDVCPLFFSCFVVAGFMLAAFGGLRFACAVDFKLECCTECKVLDAASLKVIPFILHVQLVGVFVE